MRAVLGLVLLAAAVAAGAFFADHPGRVEILWQGWQIDTSVAVLVGAVSLIVLAVSGLVLLAAALARLPRNAGRRRAARRRRTGEAALTKGLVALAAGDAAAARRYAARAEALLGGTPVVLLLAAEAATRQGDGAAARHAYRTLLERPETEFLGLRGLLGQAVRSGEDATALRLAERARLLRPRAPWLADSLIELQARAGQWEAARETIAAAARSGAITAERARHHQGVVLYELSHAAERRGAARQAAGLAAKAQKLAPDLAPLASRYAGLLIGLGRKRAAAKAIERAWRTAPHPELAYLYLDIHPAAGPLARAASLQRLAARNPEAAESHLAIAETALTAQLWGEARRHLALAVAAGSPQPGSPIAGSPIQGESRRLCLLMARLEESESANGETARDWRERAIGAPPDPCYLCRRCGGGSVQWQSCCGECGGFDTLAWRTPPHGRKALVHGALVHGALGIHPASADAPLMLPAPDVPGAAQRTA